ncbi:hypothetical protein [Tunicatimonas pelagia]|uniref:hypothetical protein n=1 Tax=Tunicatimonas pelagia TaxID=931531 RepID=UPI002666A956|nr:hypothetical protein [Tunicatimonas pelagia]WKN41427.1 hypothetical protein P0M28_20535 [Tunicatimonas pelagia]
MFEKNFPNLDWWINGQGWVELGSDEHSDSWVRILDIGGMCWEDDNSKTFEEALLAAEKWLEVEIEDRFGEVPPKKY